MKTPQSSYCIGSGVEYGILFRAANYISTTHIHKRLGEKTTNTVNYDKFGGLVIYAATYSLISWTRNWSMGIVYNTRVRTLFVDIYIGINTSVFEPNIS